MDRLTQLKKGAAAVDDVSVDVVFFWAFLPPKIRPVGAFFLASGPGKILAGNSRWKTKTHFSSTTSLSKAAVRLFQHGFSPKIYLQLGTRQLDRCQLGCHLLAVMDRRSQL
jgi:hypothetical protein